MTDGIGSDSQTHSATPNGSVLRSVTAGESPILITLGHPKENDSKYIAVRPELLFGRHCAVLGTTGSGKSWSLARIMEECTNYNCKIILFDASGEFYTFNKSTQHVYIGHDPHPHPNTYEVTVPFYHLRESDLFSMFKPYGPSQGPKLRAAIKSLKLARLSPQLAPDGTIQKAHRSKVQYDEEYRRFQHEIDSPTPNFDINLLVSQIQNECVDPQRSALEPLVWGGLNGMDHSYCVPLLNRIQDIITSPNLSSIFRPGKVPSLFDAIQEFVDADNVKVLRISLKHLPFDHSARETIANAIGLHVLELGQKEKFRRRPLLMVLDEAHQFVHTMSPGEERYSHDAFGSIAKEGRKYSVSLCLATQRPRDIPEDVLSQVGAMLIHRLINNNDRGVIERACGDIDSAAANMIPLLAPGEGILVGAGLLDPLPIRILAPTCKPESRGPDYQAFWR